MSRGSALLLAALLVVGCSAEPPPPDLPNLVLVIGDDHGFPDFGFMGSEIVQTPRLDRLAGEGVVFTTGYSTASLCRPALRSLLTGLHPTQYAQLERETRQAGAGSPMRTRDTLPRLLGRRGYVSFQAGKYQEDHYTDAGFDEGMVTRPGKAGLDQASRLARETLDPVLDFVTRNADRPFFLWFAPKLPHLPHNAPERFRELYAKDDLPFRTLSYYACISWFDESLGRLLDHLESLGLTRRTLVVYLADNGWDPRPAGDAESELLGGPQGKKTLYELGFRTPIVLRQPGVLPAGQVRDELVSIADVVPTLLDYAGAAVPADLETHSLRPLLEGRGAWPRRALIGAAQVVRTDARRLGMGGYFWRDARWHYLQPAQRADELYDLQEDPRETHDVAREHPELVKRARAEIRAWAVGLDVPAVPAGGED